jgi:hypothetical protein
MASSAPRFSKKSHHYIAQFWLRYFADPNGQLWKLQDAQVRPTSTAKVMAEDWLYTEFDVCWRPGDGVEDYLSRRETEAAQLFATLGAVPGVPTLDQWSALNYWLALTACRHPLLMRRGHQRAKELRITLRTSLPFRLKRRSLSTWRSATERAFPPTCTMLWQRKVMRLY